MTCPSFSELCAADASAMLAEHLSVCPRCRGLVARLDRSEPALGQPLRAVAPRATAGPAPQPGGVWTFWAPEVEEYVVAAVLEVGEADVLVTPVVAETLWASDADIGLTADVLGYAALAAVWASDHLLTEQAVKAVGVLSEERLAVLSAGYDEFFAGETVPSAAGPPVLGDDDPRLAAHAALADELRPFYSPWSLLHVAEELGPVLEHRREDVGLGLEGFSARLDVQPGVWAAFETAAGDPFTTIPVRAIGDALRELGLLASRRIVGLARASVLAHPPARPQAAGVAMARRRRGVRPPRERPDHEAAQAAADQYAARLERELGL